MKKTGEEYREYVLRLARESGLVEPDRERCDWTVDAREEDVERGLEIRHRIPTRIARLKDGRTRLEAQARYVVDLETGAIVSADVFAADESDASTLTTSLKKAKNIEIAKTKDGDDDDDHLLEQLGVTRRRWRSWRTRAITRRSCSWS